MGITTRLSKDNREAKCKISEENPSQMICKVRKKPGTSSLGKGDGVDLGRLVLAIDDQGNKRIKENALQGSNLKEMQENQSFINFVLNADIDRNPKSKW